MGLPTPPIIVSASTRGYRVLPQPHQRSFSTTSRNKDEADMTSVDPSLPMRPYSYYTGSPSYWEIPRGNLCNHQPHRFKASDSQLIEFENTSPINSLRTGRLQI